MLINGIFRMFLKPDTSYHDWNALFNVSSITFVRILGYRIKLGYSNFFRKTSSFIIHQCSSQQIIRVTNRIVT
jgi:hypothetical protein